MFTRGCFKSVSSPGLVSDRLDGSNLKRSYFTRWFQPSLISDPICLVIRILLYIDLNVTSVIKVFGAVNLWNCRIMPCLSFEVRVVVAIYMHSKIVSNIVYIF
jgi:hypothetical protein